MAIQIVLGMMMIIVTTIIQSGFTVVGIWALRQRVSKELTRSLLLSTLMLALFVLWLFLATLLEVWAWALLYLGSTRSNLSKRPLIFPWKHSQHLALAT